METLQTQSAILTIGHSTRSIDEFVRLLRGNEVTLLVDVRTIARSRHNPQFNEDTLPASLEAAGIGYLHLATLGGLRHAHKDSPNVAWRNLSFRGFADYMQTNEFEQGLNQLIDLAKSQVIAIMCAEAVPWRCHRSLIGDALLARGVAVEDIISETGRRPHVLTPWAHVEGTHVTYPATEATAES